LLVSEASVFMVLGIAVGVGLESESIQHRQEKKAAKKVEAAQREQSDAQSPPAYEEHEHKDVEYAGCEKKGAEQQGECSFEEGNEGAMGSR
jgi:hypothetical protein